MKERVARDEGGADLGRRTDEVPAKGTPGTEDDGDSASAEDLSSDEERAIEERLRYLGYID